MDDLTPLEIAEITGKKRAAAQAAWTSYWYDMRGTGQPDMPLGTDRDAALRRSVAAWPRLRSLLQHSSISVTQRHYREGDKLKPVR